ncbi:MAG: thiamine phosphate synthase, partial [Acidobacteriota bacterium]
LGQEDLSPPVGRQLLGVRAIIGYSTHTLLQAKEAAAMPVDYIAFGPVFPTSTKDRPDPVVGLEMLRQVKELIGDRPLVAIGGITLKTVRSVLTAGADSAAIISDVLCDADQISERISGLISLAHTV